MAAEEKIKRSYCTLVKLLPGNKIAEKAQQEGYKFLNTNLAFYS